MNSINDKQQKLNDLRDIMDKNNVDAYLIPRTDEYLNEFMAPYAERLAWLTGFTGSAGIGIVVRNKAVVMSDGRYTIQLAQEVDQELYSLENSQIMQVGDWVLENLSDTAVIGYDPCLHTPDFISKLEKAGIQTKSVIGNLIDEVWHDQPSQPMGAVSLFPDRIAGQSAAEKILNLQSSMQSEALLITMLDSIAWLLNIRGADVEHIPVSLATLIVPKKGKAQLFIQEKKIMDEVRDVLSSHVDFCSPDEVSKALIALGGLEVSFDPKHSTVFYLNSLKDAGAKIIEEGDPCIAIRASKTSAEQAAMREAHIIDGVALAKFLHWFDVEGGSGQQDELSVEEKLESFRQENSDYKEPSFSTIAGFGSNGAIVHYRASQDTNKKVETGNLLLLDSGGQYNYGTTDITRTIAVGNPSQEMIRANTLVLKGHIALAMAEFDEHTTGKELDKLARQFLHAEGLDYAHGTGHGVGCYLSVHEEAPSISPRGEGCYAEGMILSNEPGYYKEDAFGIRIENLVLIQKNEAGEFYFETITLAPIDKNLIDKKMLSEVEVQWMNAYHARIFDTISPLVDCDVKAWLEKATGAL